MVFVLEDDNFSCCYLLEQEENKMLLGTSSGKVYLGEIKNFEEIRDIDFKNEVYAPVLESAYVLLELEGTIRQIEYLNEHCIIILTNQGEIVNYNLENSTSEFLQEYKGTKYERPWRMLILDSNRFIVVGNYRRIDLWEFEEDSFKKTRLNDYGYPLFCIDYYTEEENLFLINGNDGWIGYYKDDGQKVEQFSQERNIRSKNIQKLCYVKSFGCIFSIDYWGDIHIYQLTESNLLDKLEEFNLTSYKGNWVKYSQEISQVLIGTEGELFVFSENLEISRLKIQAKQIFSLDGLDLVLTSRTIIRPNYELRTEVESIQKYRYIKIGLVGSSRVGKTCFCNRLKSGEFEATTSSFGKRVWNIHPNDEIDKKLLYYDLAGQENELFTYFPIIDDSDIILIFYNGENTETFKHAIDYYNDLKTKCPKAEFYFIQTFSKRDPKRLVKDWHIKQEFDHLKFLTPEDNIVRIDSESGYGYDEFNEKVIGKIDWNLASSVTLSQTYEVIENEINRLYDNKINYISIGDLSNKLKITKQRIRSVIIQLDKQGRIDFLKEDDLVIIEDETYEELHSLIAENIVLNGGFCSTKLIKDRLVEDEDTEKYVKNILDYYRTNNIGIIYKEHVPNHEVFIVPQKLNDDFRDSEKYEDRIPEKKMEIVYKDFELNLLDFCEFLDQYNRMIIDLSKNKILSSDYNDHSYLLITYNILADVDDETLKKLVIHFDVNNSDDFSFKQKLISHLLEKIGDNYYDYQYDTVLDYDEVNTPEDILKYFLQNPFEKQFCDFKKQLNFSTAEEKAELLKDVAALANSSYINNNKAYLIIGFEEVDKQVKRIHKVTNYSDIDQKISQLCNEYLYKPPTILIHPIKISLLKKWKDEKLIDLNLEFVDIAELCEEDIIVLIELNRAENDVAEISRLFRFMKNGRQKQHIEAQSWFRICSHTYPLRDFHRDRLKNIH